MEIANDQTIFALTLDRGATSAHELQQQSAQVKTAVGDLMLMVHGNDLTGVHTEIASVSSMICARCSTPRAAAVVPRL